MKGELKDIWLEDHICSLKSWDEEGVTSLKLYNHECCKDIGGSIGNHSKLDIHNLLANFKKSHIMSNLHTRSWYRLKDINFCKHPQFVAGNGDNYYFKLLLITSKSFLLKWRFYLPLMLLRMPIWDLLC